MGSNIRHSYHLVDESPWPFLVSTASLFLTLGAVMFFHFFVQGLDYNDSEFICFCSSSLLTSSYIYDESTLENIFINQRKIKGIIQVEKFLFLLNQKIKNLTNYDYKASVLSEEQIVYYDIFSKSYFFFNYKDFNNLIYATYVNDIFLGEVVKENTLYKKISFYIRMVYYKYNYPFFDNNFKLYDIESFFFKNLRHVKSNNDYFNIFFFFENLYRTFKFFSSEITNDKYKQFFDDLFFCLELNGIIFYDEEKKNFTFANPDYQDLSVLINRSFQPFVFGFDKFSFNLENKFSLNSNSIIEFANNYDEFSIEAKHKTDDFVFFLILSSCTNNINCPLFLNNIFFEDIKSK